MNTAKYIVVGTGLLPEMYIFGATEKHSDVAERIGKEVQSAGFVRFTLNEQGEIKPVCFGNSTSLGVQAENGDTKIAERTLGLQDELL